MSARARRTSFPEVVIERDSDTEKSSDDEEEVEDDVVESDDQEEEDDNEEQKGKEAEVSSAANKKGKAPITISLKKVCKVTSNNPRHSILFFNIISLHVLGFFVL